MEKDLAAVCRSMLAQTLEPGISGKPLVIEHSKAVQILEIAVAAFERLEMIEEPIAGVPRPEETDQWLKRLAESWESRKPWLVRQRLHAAYRAGCDIWPFEADRKPQ